MWGAERLSSRDEKILVGVWGGLQGESKEHRSHGQQEPPDHNHRIHNHAPCWLHATG